MRTENGSILKNLLVLIVNKTNDLPAWFYLQNPNVKTITVTYPSREEREVLVKGANFPSFFAKDVYEAEKEYYAAHPEELEKIQDRFVALTDGLQTSRRSTACADFAKMNALRCGICAMSSTYISTASRRILGRPCSWKKSKMQKRLLKPV